jgi:hypothetical protein
VTGGATGHEYGSGVEIRTFAGRRATNRPGAAEYLGRSRKTIDEVARKRATTGWPEPLDRVGREEWYALDDLDRFRESYVLAKEDAHRARVHQVTLAGDPDEMVTAKQFRELIGASHGTWSRYVHDSKPAWERGEDGYLPRPDDAQPSSHGVIRLWTRRRAAAWINSRPGKVPSPGRPARGTTAG